MKVIKVDIRIEAETSKFGHEGQDVGLGPQVGMSPAHEDSGRLEGRSGDTGSV
jgi:hypothetical protein